MLTLTLAMTLVDTEPASMGPRGRFPGGRARTRLARARETGTTTSEGTTPQLDDARCYQSDGASSRNQGECPTA